MTSITVQSGTTNYGTYTGYKSHTWIASLLRQLLDMFIFIAVYSVTLHKESTEVQHKLIIIVDQLISVKQFMHDCGKQSQTWYKYVQ